MCSYYDISHTFLSVNVNVIDEILSMRSRMWRRWLGSDKPPQNKTGQSDTMGIHPQKVPPAWGAVSRQGRVQVCQHTLAKPYEMLKHRQFTTHQSVSGQAHHAGLETQ